MKRSSRLQPRIPRTVTKKKRAPNVRSAPTHLALVRLLPCLLTGKPGPGDPHHLKRAFTPDETDPLMKKTATRGTGITTGDQWAIPLSRAAHDEIETTSEGEEEFLAARGFDGRAVCRALWTASPDLPAMQRVIMRARQAANLAMSRMR